mgnify:CR=1 FL=1
MNYPKPILDLIDSYSLLPGIGRKTAVRLAFHTLKMHDDDIKNFADSLQGLKEKLTNCEICHRLSETHVCDICSDNSRDKSTICVVANDNDLVAMENMQQYRGLYHVLDGLISPMDGIGPMDINIKSLFERAQDTTVKEILTPRTMVFALDMEKTIGEVWDEVVEQGFSRIPVYNETIDKIVGIVHMKDMIKYNKEEHSDMKIKELMKEPYFVPTTKTLVELLEEFKKKQSHMAIIIDEYGGTLGIVTIEDLLEEIVGEIRDEFDQEEESIQQIKETIFDIRGDTVIEELNEELDINMPVSEEYDTVSGYVQDELGKVAEEGDQVKGDGFILKVMEVDNKRIEKLRIIITEKNSEGETDDGKD